jgi:hypothetical protein
LYYDITVLYFIGDPIYSVPTTRGKQDGPGTSRGCIADRHDKKKRKEKSSKKGKTLEDQKLQEPCFNCSTQ